MPPQAIETEYAGCRFRSRLEARWAVFFDHAAISWQYEPEGFKVPYKGEVRYYLPDFLIDTSEGKLWVEVKGDPDAREEDWYEAIGGMFFQHGDVFMMVGQIPYIDPKQDPAYTDDIAWPTNVHFHEPYGKEAIPAGQGAGFGEYHKSGRPFFDFGCDVDEVEVGYANRTRHPGWFTIGSVDPTIKDAYNAARKARFEHGEAPRPRHWCSEKDILGHCRHQV